MSSKKISLIAFVLIALVQLYVPTKMILDREVILENGTVYKFKTAPVDPSDPFRGKYITLNYEINSFEVDSSEEWSNGELVYIILTTDLDGFASIQSVSKLRPSEGTDYLKTTVDYISSGKTKKLSFNYPFDRFYMKESLASNAELAYEMSLRETTPLTYALVSIKDGESVLKDVMIDSLSINEVAKRLNRH
jgi:uncharacterized membrane-anchored protein